MAYSNTDTYKMKREILNFARNFSGGLSAPDVKFFADMTYGILASQGWLLAKIAHALQEETKKAYGVSCRRGLRFDGFQPSGQHLFPHPFLL